MSRSAVSYRSPYPNKPELNVVKLIPLILVVLLAGCATASHEERDALLSQPVNCETAQEDIAALEEAMPSRGERAKSAVQSVAPVGVVTGAATGQYRDRAAVATGRTEEELSARIKEIQITCGLPESTESSDK